jgi:uncharacterized membrane protein
MFSPATFQRIPAHSQTIIKSLLTMASTTATASSKLFKLLKSSELKWACTGWTFFIAENAVLSENRTYLIEQLNSEDNYRAVYGTFSTIATASVAFAYYKLTRASPAATALPMLWKGSAPVVNMAVSWTATTLGLIVASQALPKFQIPVALETGKLKVVCPFDFADDKERSGDETVRGLERMSRHSGLWSLGFIGIGNALLQPSLPLRLWWMGPAAVAWLGGMHTDSRYRRNMGGTLDPWYDSQTSNLPFAAMLSGKQGSVSQAFSDLAFNEIKPLNALMAAGVSTVWVLSRGRVKVNPIK